MHFEGPRRNPFRLTTHARERMRTRAIHERAIELVFEFGRLVYTRGAVIYALGRAEVETAWRRGLDLAALEGLQVVCEEGVVVTVYRNRDFRGLSRRHRRLRGGSRGAA